MLWGRDKDLLLDPYGCWLVQSSGLEEGGGLASREHVG